MANVSPWCVIGISKKVSKYNQNGTFYVVSCVRPNDSLDSGNLECHCFLVSERGLDKGIKAGSSVVYFGDPKGFGFLRNMGVFDKNCLGL